MDQIIIEELELRCHIGVTEEERAQAQRITVSLNLTTIRDFNGMRDDFRNAVDYQKIVVRVQELAAAKPRRLVETLALEIAEEILQHFNVSLVDLHLRKYIIAETKSVGVRLRRERSAGARRI